jgi:hypothetical protein
MNDYIAETVLSEDGNHRAQVILDQFSYDMKPDGDCYGTVLYQETGFYRGNVDVWCERYKSTDDMESAYSSLWDDFRDLDLIESVLRGKANVCEECGSSIDYDDDGEPIEERCSSAPEDEADELSGHVERYDFSDNPIVGFDTTELREGRLVNIVTMEDLKTWGWETVEAFDEAMTAAGRPGVDPSEGNLTDFEAYANGDVYFVTVERRVIETTQIRTLTQHVIRESIREAWEEREDYGTLHGYYSTESALEYAKSVIEEIDNEIKEKSA